MKKKRDSDVKRYISIPPGMDIFHAHWTWMGPYSNGRPTYQGRSARRIVRNKWRHPPVDPGVHLTCCASGDPTCVNPNHSWSFGDVEAHLERFIIRNPSDLNGCTSWRGCVNEKGYALIGIDGKRQRASRVMWEVHFGPVPVDRMVLHWCDRRKCVALKCLHLGTAKDNSREMVERGRGHWQRRKAAPSVTADKIVARCWR